MRSARTMCVLLTTITLPLAVSTRAFASDNIKLEGTANLNEDYCTKGTTGAECSLSFEITGKAAKLIYDGMTVKGAMQECTGEVEKFDDTGMHCIKGKDTSDYICNFGYYFKKRAFGGGGDGC